MPIVRRAYRRPRPTRNGSSKAQGEILEPGLAIVDPHHIGGIPGAVISSTPLDGRRHSGNKIVETV